MGGFGRLLTLAAGIAALSVIAFVVFVVLAPHPPPPEQAVHPPAPISAPSPVSVARIPASAVAPQATSGTASVGCDAAGYEDAARRNAASLTGLVWAPFHRPETGWETYAPRIAAEIGVRCAPDSPRFAAALAHWQGAHGLSPSGALDPGTFGVMNTGWELARPFVRVSQTGVCPDPPDPTTLAWATADEGYAGKPVQLRAAALAAYRRLVADARRASPVFAADRRLLTIFSGYRSPQDDAARCAREGNCGNVARALCSAHRTGLAMDLYLGAAPGRPPDSADDANRLYQSRTPAYAWLIAHAGQEGFVNYPFEPWHWEWTGEPPQSSADR